MNPIVVKEHVTRVAPLGLRFWDAVTRSFVSTGLEATIHAQGMPWQRRALTRNASGIFIAQNLPSLRDLEHGAGDETYWNGIVARPHVVEVRDREGRFLPFSFGASIPSRDVLILTCAVESPFTGPGVPLFSAPARAVPAVTASLRAELWDPVRDAPAAGAVLRVRLGGTLLARGIADERGRVVVFFAYPEPDDFPTIGVGLSPLAPSGASLLEQRWAVAIDVAYAAREPFPASPDLCATLAQPAARLFADAGRTTLLAAPTLAYGEELVLRGSGPSGPLSRVFVGP